MWGGERAQGLLKPPQNGDYQSNLNGYTKMFEERWG